MMRFHLSLSSIILVMMTPLCSWTAADAFISPKVVKPLNEVADGSFLRKVDYILTTLQNPVEQLVNHTYLSGNYAPVSQEHVQVPVEVIEGCLPRGIDGMFCRNGPNPVSTRPFKKKYHWFDGHAMLHNLRIQNGEATYTNQFVPSVRYRVEEELNEEFFPTLGEYNGIFGLMKILFHPAMVRQKVPDLNTVLPPNTNVMMYQNKFYCLNEGNIPFECQILPDGTLKAVDYETFNGLLDYPVSAHPIVDGDELLFHSYTTNTELIERDGTMKVGRFNATTGRLSFYFAPTTEKYISFAHNILHTKNYMIIWDCSVHFDPKGMFDGGSFFRTKSEFNLRFGIIPKTATGREDVIWIDTGKPGAIVHPLNSWEDEDGSIVIWTPLCENLVIDLEADDINRFNMVEYVINPTTGECSMTRVDNTINIEFSVVPKTGVFTRYGYTAIQDRGTPGEGSFSGFCTWDMVERTYRAVYYDENEVGGEPIVIQGREEETSSDERIYVGTYVYNMVEEKSYFLLYDGETNELVSRLLMPFRVPFGFHGQWISSGELQDHYRHHGLQEEECVEPELGNKSG